MRASSVLALAASLSVACAQQAVLGFNSGATDVNNVAKTQSDFEKELATAQKLKNSPGLTAIRLYTNIKPYSTDDPIEAFAAAIKYKTKILLGMWCSGTDSIENELNALSKAIEKYGKDFTDLVIGISVGSEDMYRVSEDGIKNKSGLGAEAKLLVKFIKDTRNKLKGTALSSIPVGHVDTSNAWYNGTNKAVIDEVDFLGMNAFPYYENTKKNDIDNAEGLFKEGLAKTEAVAGDKPVWITETGWPISGPKFGDAITSKENSKTYWDTVGCPMFGKRNVFWYTLQDNNPDNAAKFGITKDYSTTPQFDLTCPVVSDTPAPTKNSTGNANAPADESNENNGNGNGNNNAGNSTSDGDNTTNGNSTNPAGGDLDSAATISSALINAAAAVLVVLAAAAMN